MAIYRVTAEWQGFPGAPGYSNFHFTDHAGGDESTDARQAVHDFFSALASAIPSGMTIEVLPTVEVYDESTGLLTGWDDSSLDLDVVEGTRTGGIVGPAGAVVNWITGTVVNGRRLRGRTFLVPLSTWAYEGNGTLDSEALDLINNAASILSSPNFGHNFVIWSRPTGGGTGQVGQVINHRVPDMAAVLRSRRD